MFILFILTEFNFVLHLFSFKTPPLGADLSKEGDADCALEMRNGVNSL